MTTSAMVSTSVNCTSLTDARIVTVRSVRTSTLMAGGMAACSCGKRALMRSTVSMTFAPGCFKTARMMARLPFAQAASKLSFRTVDRLTDVANAHRSAVLVRDDGVVPRLGAQHLIVGIDRETCA